MTGRNDAGETGRTVRASKVWNASGPADNKCRVRKLFAGLTGN